MAAKIENRVTRRDVARVLFRHSRKIACFFFAVVLLTLVAIAVLPRSYSSEAKLFIRVGRESVSLDPTATTGDTILLQKTQVDEVNSALDILAGRAILQGVVDRIGADRILTDAPSAGDAAGAVPVAESKIVAAIGSARSTVATWAQQIGLSDPGSANDRAVRRLESNIKVWAPKESTVITITCTAASPELAHDIVAAATETFVDQHVKNNQTHGSLEFFSQQVDELFTQLTAAEAELRDRKNSFQLTTNGNRGSIIEKSKEGMRQKIYDLQLAENDLKARYTDEYPPLREIRRQREEAEAMLARMPTGLADGPAAKSVARPDARVTAVQAVAISESTASPAASEGERVARIDSELQMLNDQDLQLAQLQRKVELLDAKYRMHVQKLEQARVNEALGHDRITNVNVAQPAAFITKPVSPKKPLILALGLATATCGAIGLAFISESCDQTLRTTEQVQARLGLPVLASLPFRRRLRDPAIGGSNNGSGKNGQAGNGASGQQSDYRSLVHELVRTNGTTTNGHASKLLGVVGCGANGQRSRVAGDLAIQAAQSTREPVLLIDADADQRNVAKRFHINGDAGWWEVLAGSANAENCIHRQENGNLSVMGPGKSQGQTTAAKNAVGPLTKLKSEFGLVVVDLPPDSDSDVVPADAMWLDEVVLVVEAERTHIQSAQHAQQALSRAGVHVTGVVLTNRREYIPRWLYQRL